MAEYLDDLASLIDVNTGSTVSRTVLSSDAVRVVLFSFDTGEELSEHTAAMPVLISVLDGALDVTAGGQTHRMRPGALLSLESREPHSVVAVSPSRMILTMVTAARS